MVETRSRKWKAEAEDGSAFWAIGLGLAPQEGKELSDG